MLSRKTIPARSDLGISHSYPAWLRRQGISVFRGETVTWQLYKTHVLIPATSAPCYVDRLSKHDRETLLRNSRAWFLRYSSDPCIERTEWWHIICDELDSSRLSSKVRNQVRRGQRECLVKRIDPTWLAANGYACYQAAHDRYKHASASPPERFHRNIMRTIDGPFEYWGVFVNDVLIGYCQCIIEEKNVATNVIKFDPRYLKHYSSYALISHLIQRYVTEQGMVISNGTRPIAHDTQFQELLLKLGFRRQFCRLRIDYRSTVGLATRVAFPFRQLLPRLPASSSVIALRSLLFQEELRRLCE
jgi:hypothetical protein